MTFRAKRFLIRKIFESGINFHPDTLGSEYVNKDGKPTFTPRQAKAFDRKVRSLFEGLGDPYKISCEEMERYMKNQTTDEFEPGPWKITDLRADQINASVCGKRSAHVAVVWSGHKPSMTRVKANALLISAAPDLLEVARLAKLIGNASSSADFMELHQAADRAVAKAVPS